MNAERKLRKRIRRVLSVAGHNPAKASRMVEAEDQVLDLFRQYSKAPEHRKDEVYARGERKIVNAVGASRIPSRRSPR